MKCEKGDREMGQRIMAFDDGVADVWMMLPMVWMMTLAMMMNLKKETEKWDKRIMASVPPKSLSNPSSLN